MSKLNAEWHRCNPMPGSASLAQRVEWHIAHARACACREIPATVKAELRKRGIAVPKRK